jgi:antitoxin component YwqK of YwqJK toxin-antitoxin module
MSKLQLLCLALALALSSCASNLSRSSDPCLASINIIDRNGVSQTISNKDRLKEFEKTNFSASQPYKKVMRVYARDKSGNSYSEITSYHSNGQISQKLDVLNNRAQGQYSEWYSNGQRKLEAYVIGGNADLTPNDQQTWLFDGVSNAWDEEGNLIANIPYSKGDIEGCSKYYHANASLKKEIPFYKNSIEGEVKTYSEQGITTGSYNYVNNQKHGRTYTYSQSGKQVLAEEQYCDGKLYEANYWNAIGDQVGYISEGFGWNVSYKEDVLSSRQQFRHGIQEGIVEIYNDKGQIDHTFTMVNKEKHGEEVFYFVNPLMNKAPQKSKPKLSLFWYHNRIQGLVKTWYENGQQESQKEMNQNVRHGLATSWYQNGTIMMIEEYDHDKLLKGEYIKKGEVSPTSRINNGKGIATLFDQDGNFIKKVNYHDGFPQS